MASIPCVVLAGGKAKPDIQAATGQTNRALVVANGKTLLRHVIDAVQSAGHADRERPSPPTPLPSLGEGSSSPHPQPISPIGERSVSSLAGQSAQVDFAIPDRGFNPVSSAGVELLMGPITVVGDVPPGADYACVPDNGGFVENVFAGVSVYADAPFVLVATSDLPFLTGEAVEDFVRGAMTLADSSGAGFVWPIVPVEACYARFPGVKRTSLKLREGVYTGGNLMLARPQELLAQRQRIGDAYAARKSPMRLAMKIGLGTLARLLISQKFAPNVLTLGFLEAQISRLLGTPARAFVCSYPEIATDMDRASDFAAVGLAQKVTRKGEAAV